jgi:hypothetical protein
MAEQPPQTFENHVRRDPAFHFFLAPLAIVLFGAAIAHAVRHPSSETIWMALMGLTVLCAVFLTRIYSLKVQNRVIRMEERLRLKELLPAPLVPRIGELTGGQLIALRFASDAEIPALVSRALDQKMAPPDIKRAITNWRPDYHRV